MTGLSLSLIEEPRFELDVGQLLPEILAGQSLKAIKLVKLQYGKRRAVVGDFFAVEGLTDGDISFHNATAKLQRIGHAMTSGTINIVGTAGDELGAQMTGGKIQVDGNASDYVGSGMRGGMIEINGRTGDFTGGALPDSPLGMRGGVICVNQKTGDRTGERMRRGLLIINGDTGRYCGSNMIAGTIVVSGQLGTGIGLGMRRGTLVLFNQPTELTRTFNDCGPARLAILALLSRYVKTLNRKAYLRLRSIDEVRRYTGDRGCDGQGEVLVAIG
jgi:formylmethanofuran dehydrogenase subunit C